MIEKDVVIRYDLFANGIQRWIFNETIGNGSIVLTTDGTRVTTVNGTVAKRQRAKGIEKQTEPTLFSNETQVYDIWHGSIIWFYMNGTQTADRRGYSCTVI